MNVDLLFCSLLLHSSESKYGRIKSSFFTEAMELSLGNDIALLAKATHFPSHAPKDGLRKYFLFKSVIVIKIFNRYTIFATIYGYCKSCVRI